MPRVKHVKSLDYKPTFRTEKVASMFDVPVGEKLEREWDTTIPTEEMDWSVGLIVGHSGAGKTTIAKEAFGEEAYFDGNEWGEPSMLDDFSDSLGVEEITTALSHVGLSSPPAWLLPYSALSNGQKFRADLARAVLETEGLVVFDEFTSVVDRQVAQIGAHAAQKFVRRQGRQLVAVTCHYDVTEWLEPDWVYDVTSDQFHRGRLRRPPINIQVEQCHRSAWSIFKEHHYLSSQLNNNARCFVAFVDGDPAAFSAVVSMPHPKKKNIWKGHRTVVLPDYQGVGLGNALVEAVGDKLLAEGKTFLATTSHPAMVAYRSKSPKWIMTRKPSRAPQAPRQSLYGSSTAHRRLSAAFRYVGKTSEAGNEGTA